MHIFKVVFVLLLTVTFATPVFAGESVNRSVDPIDGYIEDGDFYWTRLYWKGTKDAFSKGALYFTNKFGTTSRTNLWLIAGMDATAENAEILGRLGWHELKKYGQPTKLLPNVKDGETWLNTFVRFFTKPWGLFTHKWDKTVRESKENWSELGNSSLKNWGAVGQVLGFAWNGLSLVFDPVRILALEMPLELVLRVLPKSTGKLLYRTGEPLVRTAVPMMTTSFLWFVMEPVNVALNGVPSATVGVAGTVLTGVTSVAEGTKFVVWDFWHGDDENILETEDGKKVGAVIRVPERPSIAKRLDKAFAEARSEAHLRDAIDHVVVDHDNEAWVALSYAVSKLSESVKTLTTNSDKFTTAEKRQVHKEIAQLNELRSVFNQELRDSFAQAVN